MSKILSHEVIDKMSDREIIDLIQSATPIARARRLFTDHRIKLAEEGRKKQMIDPLSMRRAEFKAIIEISRALGVKALGS